MIEQLSRVVVTHHAFDRIAELGMTRNKAVWMFYNSEEEQYTKGDRKHMSEYKRKKYSDHNVQYFRNGSVIFTARRMEDRFNPEKEIWLLITVTDQRLTANVYV